MREERLLISTQSRKLSREQGEWSKNQEDILAMLKESRSKEEDEQNQFRGSSQLESAGEIEEAAAVFSEKGIQIFSQMISHTFKEELRAELPKLIQEMVRAELKKQMMEMMRGLLRGIEGEIEAVPRVETTRDKMNAHDDKEYSQEAKPIEKKEIEKARTRRKRRTPREEVIIGVLQESGKPMKLREIVEKAEERGISLGNNPTNVVRYIMSKEPSLKRTNQHGYYQYVENEER
ncbi:winged helix-turn-helix domain-containing protein [Mechercharimyces sp. CAU 1602]|uniref:winged helix-turn-helix domain-containing protein n=1 Tax=Mechercharimyces sp. CAU 1602 TaxID=2973933 RepID=UPI0021638040|nr:winged helix-turn-helix domain-containing protein [Mechercharimyces sp. CAU 1602]